MTRKFLAICFFLFFTAQAQALRCGNKLVSIGDRMHKVHRLCGDPTYVDAYDQALSTYGYSQGSVHVEVWTYNFGRNRFMREMIFENGVLRYINQLGYGY